MKRPLNYLADTVWAGNEASLQEYLNAMEGIQAQMLAGPMNPHQESEDDLPYLLSIDEDIATVTIAGPLTNRDSWMNELFGVTSYGAIREALIHAASDPSIKHIVLDINSGGGSVNGVADTADLVRLVNDRVKPVTAFTDGNMCSAAYWIGCSAGSVYASNIATVGSIGVIATHMERSKQLKDDGVGVTVMRAGQFKALVNGVEPLTAAAKAQMQESLDTMYGIFVDHVAAMTDHPRDYVDANMAQGREFIGEQALSAGLVDGITKFDALISEIRASQNNPQLFSDSSRNLAQGTTMKNKKAFTEQEIAALAEGGAATQATSPAAADAAGNSENLPEGDGVTNAAAEGASAEAASAAEAAKPSPDVLSFLQAQVKEKDAQLLATSVELSGLKAKQADMEASFAGLVEIAGKSINNMMLNLSGGGVDVKSLSATEVLALHKSTSDQFQSKFKAGGVAAVDAAEASKDDKQTAPSHMRAARLAAVLPTAKAK